MSSINTSNINIDDSGRVTISGSSSGINSREIIDATITARRIPAVQLETRISENTETINAYGQLDTLNEAFVNALNKLRGSTSFFADNTFDSKTASGTTAAASGAPAGHTPSDTSTLISAAVSSSAETGKNTIEINQLAQASQIRSDAFTSRTATLSSLGVTTGDISVNGQTVTIDADDTLNELRSKINTADAGVTASIVSANDTQHFLVLTATNTGASNAININAITSTTPSGSAPNLMPTNAGFEADNAAIPNDGNFQVGVTGWSSTGGNLAAVNAATADFPGNDWTGEAIMTMTTGKTAYQDLSATFDSSQTYNLTVDLGNRAPVGATSDYAVRLYAGSTLVGEVTGTSTVGSLNEVSLNVDGSAFAAQNGETLRIEFANTSGAELALDNVSLTASTAAETLGFVTADDAIKTQLTAAQDANLTVNGIENVTRSSNEIDDIIDGVTLSLFQAEENTVITLDISADLNSVKTDLVEFANTFNDLRTFIDDQRAERDRDDDGDEEFGVLAFDSNLRQIASQMSQIIGTEVGSNADGFKSLGQIGLELNADFQIEVDDETLDNKLLTGVNDIQKLFEINVESSSSLVQLVDRSGSTAAGTYTLNIGGIDASGNIISANINGNPDGSDDGSVTISGKTITATDATAANGLRILYNGADSSGAASGISVTVNRGVADLFYDTFNDYSKLAGTLDDEIGTLADQNTSYESRIETIDARLEITRQRLERQYIAMETALAQLESLREQINSFFNNDNDN